MLRIMKYDFIKKYRLFAIFLITAALINLLLVFNYTETGSMLFIGLFPVVLSILYIVDIIKMYSDELNKKSGYMLFMTPNSGYSIVLSKVSTAVVEGVAVILLISLISIINASYVAIYNGYEVGWNFIEFLNQLLNNSLGIHISQILVILFAMLLLFITFILTVYTSMTIRKSIFSEIKFGGLFSFIIFIALNWGISVGAEKISNLIEPSYSQWLYDSLLIPHINPTAGEMFLAMLPSLILMVLLCSAMTAASGYLLEKRINL